MRGKTSRTSWTSRRFGEICARRRNVTVMKPWTDEPLVDQTPQISRIMAQDC